MAQIEMKEAGSKQAAASARKCRFCQAPLTVTFVNLGMSPLANSYLKASALNRMEPFYPLHVYVCSECLFIQLEEFESPEAIFSDYAYFSSYSEAWLKHAEAYTDMMITRFGFNEKTQVVEIASNDGYLLQYFKKRNVPVLGVEPAANVAKVAEEKGIPSLIRFFGVETAKEMVRTGIQADLLLGNNVLAHVPDLNGFVAGMKILLKPEGIITMEFPHLLRLIAENQFDTIYHEHFSYFSLIVVEKIFEKHGFILFDVEEIPTHGGSLRIFARHPDAKKHANTGRVEALKQRERQAGLDRMETYSSFAGKVMEIKSQLLSLLIEAKRRGKRIVGYGAPAKGNTLLNVCGVRTDFIDYTVDRSPYKQGYFLPGTHIPIYQPDKIKEDRPDYILILPWNLKDEIIMQMAYIREWGGEFIVPIPKAEIIP